MSVPRRVIESRAGQAIVGVTVVIAAGAAITAGIADGVFEASPPACYVSSPTAGATITGSTTVSATCGTTTTNTQFVLDHTFIISIDGTTPFSTSWNSASASNGSHTLTVFACDVDQNCVESNAVTVTTSNNSAPVNTSSPSISGGLTVGSVDTCTSGSWSGDTSSGFAYQWKDGAGNISAATSSTYTIASGELGLFLSCQVTATGTGGSASATSAAVGPVQAAGSLTTAHVWLSAAGNDGTCARNASAVSYATALSSGNVCLTGPVAYQKASLGDNILVEGAPFTATTQWFFTRAMTKSVTSGTCDYNYDGVNDFSNCVTIEPASGQALTIAVPGPGGTAGQDQVKVCVAGLSIQNATWTETDYTDQFGDTVSNGAMTVGSGDNTCGTAAAPHDDYFFNNVYGGQVAILGGTRDVSIVGGTAISAKDFPWQFGGSGNNGALLPNNNDLVGVTFDGFNFANNDSAHHHMECVHANGNDINNVFAGNRFEGCPVESLFFETVTSTAVITGNLIENNYFDGTGGANGGPFKMDCANAGCTLSNNTIRFNSFAGPWLLQCAANSGTSCNIDNNTFYGNVGIGCVAVGAPHGGTTVGTGWIDGGYNVQGVAKSNTCTANTSSYSATISFVSSGPPNYNLDLNGAQTATAFVPAAVTGGWPLTNIYGATRSGSFTNAGGN